MTELTHGKGFNDPYLEALSLLLLLRIKKYNEVVQLGPAILRKLPYCLFLWEIIGESFIKSINGPVTFEEINLTFGSENTLFVAYLMGAYGIGIDGSNGLNLGFLEECAFVLALRARIAYNARDIPYALNILDRLHHKSLSAYIDCADLLSDIWYLDGDRDNLKHFAFSPKLRSRNLSIFFYVKGNYHALVGEHKEARQAFLNAAQENPRNGSVWILIAQQCLELKDPEAAIESYLKSTGILLLKCPYVVSSSYLEIHPFNYKSWYGLGQVYELLGNDQLALEHYCQARFCSKIDFRVPLSIGKLYLKRNQPEAAVKSLIEASDCTSSPPDVLLELGNIFYSHLRRLDDALRVYYKYFEELLTTAGDLEEWTMFENNPKSLHALVALLKDCLAKSDFVRANKITSILTRFSRTEIIASSLNDDDTIGCTISSLISKAQE